MEVKFEFNGIDFQTDGATVAEMITQAYREEIERRAAARRASPEGRADLIAREQALAAQVQAVNELLTELPAHIGTESRLVDWIGRLAVLDQGVGFDLLALVTKLEAAGYVRNDLVGDKNLMQSKSNLGRWIVGQAIDSLHRNHAVHPVLSVHVAKYTSVST